MKKLWFVFLFTLTGLFAFSQFSPIYVSGNVTDVNGNPLPFHSVTINADSSMGGWNYHNVVHTDSLGHFSITITPPAGIIQGFKAYTYDCRQDPIDSFFTNSTQHINLHFAICIPNHSCEADFGYYPDSSGLFTMHFYNLSSGSPTSFYWSFGDGTYSALQNPTHTYPKGLYHVCLTITDSSTNCSDVYCRQVYVDDSTHNNPCSTGFSYHDSNLTVKFSGYSHSSGSKKTISYNWDFGDGTYGSGQNPVHNYSSYTTWGYYVYLVTTVIDSLNDTCISRYGQHVCQQQAGSVMGVVSSKTYSVDHALVYLIKYNPTDSTLTAIDSVFAIDSSGVNIFFFGNVPFGDYLVKAALTTASANYSHCMPTYYGDVLFWNQATTININYPNHLVHADIEMLTGTNPGGPGFIGGKTTKGANIWALNPGDPIKNIEILLLDQSGNPIACNYSKATGDFGFNSLAYGTYQIYAEIPGKTTIPAYVTIDAQNPTVNDVQIVISKKSIKTSIKPDISVSISQIGSIYPNPVQEKLNLYISLKKAIAVDVQITNNLGQLITTTAYKLKTGQNTISFNTQNLPQGMYILNLKSSDGANIFKNFTIIK